MKIISWNIRGLGSRKKRRVVKDFLRFQNLDVVMFQETKREVCVLHLYNWACRCPIWFCTENKTELL